MGYMINTVSYNAPVFTYSFPQLVTKKECEQYKERYPQSNNSNVFAWHSHYNTHETTNIFNRLIKLTINTCTDITQDYFNIPIQNPYHYDVDDLWLAMYECNDYTVMHDHFPNQFAACYYVDVKDDSSPITFGVNNVTTSIQPETGMLLVWNGLIPHKVEPTNKKRICICMNIGMKENVKSSTYSTPIFN